MRRTGRWHKVDGRLRGRQIVLVVSEPKRHEVARPRALMVEGRLPCIPGPGRHDALPGTYRAGVEAARVAVDLLRDRGSRSAMRRGRSAVEVKADSA